MKALCLWDPVDVTVYAPQSAEYPSAVAALRSVQSSLPVAIVGGGKAGDCVPKDSNYRCLPFCALVESRNIWRSIDNWSPSKHYSVASISSGGYPTVSARH